MYLPLKRVLYYMATTPFANFFSSSALNGYTSEHFRQLPVPSLPHRRQQRAKRDPPAATPAAPSTAATTAADTPATTSSATTTAASSRLRSVVLRKSKDPHLCDLAEATEGRHDLNLLWYVFD